MNAVNLSGFALNGTNVASDAAQITTYWCTEAVTLGDWISFYDSDTTNPAGMKGYSVRKADGNNADAVYGTFGVATQTLTAAGPLAVQVKGYCAVANVTTSADGQLSIGTASAGRAINYAGTNPELRVIGVTQAAASGDLAAVFIFEHPRLSA